MNPNPFCLRHDVNVSHGICEYSIKWNDVTLKHTGYTECIVNFAHHLWLHIDLCLSVHWKCMNVSTMNVQFAVWNFIFIHKRNKMFCFSYIIIHEYVFLLFFFFWLKLFNWKHNANLMINNTIKNEPELISITNLQLDINSTKRANIYIKHHNQTDHQNIIHVWLHSIYMYMSLRSAGSCFCIFPYKWNIWQGVVWECRS